MNNNEFQGGLNKIIPYLLTTILFVALVGLAWAQTTEVFYYSYDEGKQLRRAVYVNRTTNFTNHTTLIDYVYDNMGNRQMKTVDTAVALNNNMPGDLSYIAPYNNTTSVNMERSPLRWHRSIDPDGDNVSYVLNFGTTNPPPTPTVRERRLIIFMTR